MAAERRRIDDLIIYALLTLASAFALFPVFWMLSSSLRPDVQIFRIPPSLLPTEPTLVAYTRILGSTEYVRPLANSAIIAIAVTIVSLVLAVLAAYGFSRFDFGGNRVVQTCIIATQSIPPITLIVPYFILITSAKLYNTYPGLIITYASFVLPFATLMMTSYFNTVPPDMEEAAMVDGCGRLGALVRVLLPMATPGLLATGVYAFLLAWNEFLFGLTLTQTGDMRPVTVAIALLQGEHITQWSMIMGLSVIASTPLIILFLFLQRYLISGMTAGAVKN